MKTFKILIIATGLCISCPASAYQVKGLFKKAEKALTNSGLSEEEIGKGLREALIKGISVGSDLASQLDGYFGNPSIKLPFPPDAQRVETTLRNMGFGAKVDEFILTLNRGAEKAAKESKDIFIEAIRAMTIQDALGILKGEDDAATQYLMRTTTQTLFRKFQPIIKKALDEVNATRYYADLVNTYNKVPLVRKANPDLDEYATNKAIEGLFYLIAIEEGKIRKDPLARTSDILKKVFSQQD
jgi:hypothetical protein